MSVWRHFWYQKNLSRLQKGWYFGSWQIYIFWNGVSPWLSSKIWHFLSFFFLGQIDQKECLATFLIQKIFSRLQKRWYFKVEKFAFFTKGLVHDCGQKSEVSSPWLFSFKLIKKSVNRLSSYKTSYCRQQKP